jgi:precorrin-8X/cobalt-precorrin-8 methylmutase
MTGYIRDPQLIYAQSFAIIRKEARLDHLPDDAVDIAIRVIHACGMTEVSDDLVITTDFATACKSALKASCKIFVDVEMVRHGIIARKLFQNDIICTLNDERARAFGLASQTTRSAAAVSLWRDRLQGSIAVIGNAPTALFALLEMIASGAPKPAAIVGFPVGFDGAAESKEQLLAQCHGIPFAILRGRRGGSAMAAAVINALADSSS